MLYAEDFRSIARRALNGKWGLAVGTGLVAGLLGAGADLSSTSSVHYNEVEHYADSNFGIVSTSFFAIFFTGIVIYIIISLLLGGVIQIGYCRFNLNLIHDTNPKFSDLFSKLDLFWKAFGMQLLIGLYTILWCLLFIIPGIVASISYAMTPYILEDNPSLGIKEAIKQSKSMMYGNKWRFFCLGFSFIGWIILCAFTLGIGFLWLNPYVSAAYAAFYDDVSGKSIAPEGNYRPEDMI
ncbi:DUF975 family protein [Anaerocolumna sp. MB42-C2]|uniref:DUF975 family protein n=1 Tax=Anaerocolumna sp. MB42-C2 TaxID=3070997 RepID=UPI0027E08A0A|nr:DUF975 family protein [Anaerocolumna sp. MB42-C2]WMJ90081.1 DUF975 family protein [Anaerocolumna sp. MB42-C2]